ncbi:MAG: phosphoribosylamine--glycine ligase [Gemmatimonadales bacterium]
MRVLIIGGGGREHALAWRLARDDPSLEIIAAPGNPGMAELGECVPIAASDLPGLARLATERAVDLTIVGPEAPLAAGIVDLFRAAGQRIFGPTRAAAEIETSKAFAKQLMLEEGIPTARAEIHSLVKDARACARRFGTPVVIKASGLAGGKGVIVCRTIDEADRAISEILEENRFGSAGAEVLVEEFMEGEEVSVFAITDGSSSVILPWLQDHKRLLDDDMGPNTGGMGAYLPIGIADADHLDRGVADREVRLRLAVERDIVAATLAGLARRGRPFTGLLYAGLMITPEGPKVVEFNCRFGDPETEALMPVLELRPSLLELMLAASSDEGFDEDTSEARIGLTGACATTVLAAARYPETPRSGDVISLPPAEEGVVVFHAGTARDAEGRLITAGGRVLAVSAVASTVAQAAERSREFAGRIRFSGRQFRTDIGWREVARQRHSSPQRARAPRD